MAALELEHSALISAVAALRAQTIDTKRRLRLVTAAAAAAAAPATATTTAGGTGAGAGGGGGGGSAADDGLRLIEFFSGIGGMRLALESALAHDPHADACVQWTSGRAGLTPDRERLRVQNHGPPRDFV